MTVRFVETQVGRIHYAEQGHGEVLLLLHSNGCSHHSFQETMARLAPHFRCVAWDMPGHGDSEPGSRHLSVDDYAAAVIAFMDALGVERAHVCGTSIGGMICLALGRSHPDRLLSIVIAEAPLRSSEMWEKSWSIVEATFTFPQQSQEEIALRVRNATPALVQRWNMDRCKAGSWRMMDVMWALREFDAITAATSVRCPCSIIIGSLGPVATSRATYESLLPQAPIIFLDGVGHFPMLDDASRFASSVLDGITRATRDTRAISS